MSEDFTPRKELFKRYREAFGTAWANRKSERRSRRYLSVEADFLPASLAVSERPTPVMPHVALWMICGFVILAILWSMIGRIDIVVMANGKVLSGGKTKAILPIESQIVKAVYVRDGMHVKEGDVLIEFDTMSSDADIRRYSKELERASALVEAYGTLLRTLETNAASMTRAPAIKVRSEEQVFAETLIQVKWAEFLAKVERAQAELERRRGDFEVIDVTEKTAIERLQQQREIERDFREMQRAAAVPRHALIEQEVKLQDLLGEVSRLSAQKRQATLSVQEAEAALSLVTATERVNWRERLNDAQRDAYIASSELEKSRYRSTTNKLTAPVSGRVQQLSVLAPGTVAPASQQALAIVPDAEIEEVEVLIENRDVGFIRIGQRAEVKFETYDYTRYGTMPATIVYISPDAVADERGVLRYQTRLKLEATVLSANGRSLPITPGMSVMTDIMAGRRTIITYFLSPIMKTISEAARER